MLLPIKLQKDYTLNAEGYQLKLPLSIETIIPEDDSVRLLSQFVEAMDLTDLYTTYDILPDLWSLTAKGILTLCNIHRRTRGTSKIYESF